MHGKDPAAGDTHGHHHDINPNEDLVAVIVGHKTSQNIFRRTVQQSSPGSEKLAGRSEMHVVLQAVLQVADDDGGV